MYGICEERTFVLLVFVLQITQFNFIYPLNLEKKYGQIIHISAIFRHGARTPYSFYPTDPYKSYSWPGGIGQITQAGEKKCYNLGKWYRRRYRKLLKSVSSHTFIKVDSSDLDRSIMSGQAFLASFYYPKYSAQRLHKNLPWQPLPIHTVPIPYDNMLFQAAECPALQHDFKKFFQGSKMRKLFKKYRKTFKYLGKHSKLAFTEDNIYEAELNAYELWDTLRIEKEEFKLKLPHWANKIFPQPITKIVESFNYKEYAVLRVRRLMAGPFLKSLSSDLIKRAANENSTNYFHFYFAHDQTIGSVMATLGVYNNINPPYAASLIFELRKKDKRNYLTLWYKNSTIQEPMLLKIPKCGKNYGCDTKHFFKMIRPVIPQNWNQECILKNETNKNDSL